MAMATSSSSSQKPAEAPPLPCLVFDYGADAEQPMTLYSVADGVHHPCMEELRGKRMSWMTSHGWVLSCDPATLATVLWSPHAGAKIVLPPFAHQPPHARSHCALSGKPTDAAGFTVVVVEPLETTAFWYCHVGGAGGAGEPPSSSGWSKHEYDLGGTWVKVVGGKVFAKRTISHPTSYRGRFYYYHCGTKYGVLDLSPASSPSLTTVPMKAVRMPMEPGEFMASSLYYTLDLEGELYAACIFFRGVVGAVTGVGVYKVDFGKRRHVKVGSVGDRAILAGSGELAQWCSAGECGLRPNSIYWASPYDKRLHVYDVSTRREEAVHDICKDGGVPEFWMVPDHP